MFRDVLFGLRCSLCKTSLLDDTICGSFFVLAELCGVCLDGTKIRPICSMVYTGEGGLYTVDEIVVEKYFCYDYFVYHSNLICVGFKTWYLFCYT